jgi:phenylpyruvate tautomerase PptA (4-oxalocrotonate tautomerase family)
MGDVVHQALVATASVPPDDQFQIIHQLDPGALIAHTTYGGVSRSDDLIIIQITLNAGRSLEVKKALYAEIARALQKELDVRPDDVLVSLVQVTKEDWSFGGGRATYA